MYNEIDLDKIDIKLGPPAKEPARQYYFIAKCREWVRDFEQRNGRVPNSCVTTFGCQMNARDSESWKASLSKPALRRSRMKGRRILSSSIPAPYGKTRTSVCTGGWASLAEAGSATRI